MVSVCKRMASKISHFKYQVLAKKIIIAGFLGIAVCRRNAMEKGVHINSSTFINEVL